MSPLQMIPKRPCVVHVEHHTTSVAIGIRAAATHVSRCSRTDRRKVVPDNREVAANARPSVRHAGLCTLAEHEPCTGVPPRMDPLLVMEEDPLLHSLVDLREPTCRRCIQLRLSFARISWISSSGKAVSIVWRRKAAPKRSERSVTRLIGRLIGA